MKSLAENADGFKVMPKIVDVRYRQFLDTGLINIIGKKEFEQGVGRIEHKSKAEAIQLVTLLFYTGRRPAEILDLKPTNIEVESNYLIIQMVTKKKGVASRLYFPLANPVFKSFLAYSKHFHDLQYLFPSFRTARRNNIKTRNKQTGVIKEKVYIKTTEKIYYWIKKWFWITPYFFRHSRFSDLAEKGATERQIMHLKGARDAKSVAPYLHLSSGTAKGLSKFFSERKIKNNKEETK